MENRTCTVHPAAYGKLMLHLVKNPHTPVSGYLSGRIEGSTTHVVDAVPLFHSHALGPLLEVATAMVDSQVADGQTICGYYFASERLDDRGLPIVAERIASTVEAKQPGAVLLQVLNDKLADPSEHALQVWGKSKSGLWNVTLGVKAEDGDKTLKMATSVATTCVEQGLHAAYSDFDDHFEDPARNPFNPDVSKAIEALR